MNKTVRRVFGMTKDSRSMACDAWNTACCGGFQSLPEHQVNWPADSALFNNSSDVTLSHSSAVRLTDSCCCRASSDEYIVSVGYSLLVVVSAPHYTPWQYTSNVVLLFVSSSAFRFTNIISIRFHSCQEINSSNYSICHTRPAGYRVAVREYPMGEERLTQPDFISIRFETTEPWVFWRASPQQGEKEQRRRWAANKRYRISSWSNKYESTMDWVGLL